MLQNTMQEWIAAIDDIRRLLGRTPALANSKEMVDFQVNDLADANTPGHKIMREFADHRWGQNHVPDHIQRLAAKIRQKTSGSNPTGVEFCLTLTCMLAHEAVLTADWSRVEGVDQDVRANDCVEGDLRRWHMHTSVASIDSTAAWTWLLSLGPTEMAMNELNSMWQQENINTVYNFALCVPWRLARHSQVSKNC